jgi:hypothetical protein
MSSWRDFALGLCVFSGFADAAPPSSCRSRVDPSTSVKTKVTVLAGARTWRP